MRASFLPGVRTAAVIVTVTGCGAVPCTAQNTPAKTDVEHVAVILGVARPYGGPSQALDAAMRAADFDDTDPTFFGLGGQPHPVSFDWGTGMFAEIRVPVTRRLALGVIAGLPSRGSIIGYNADFRYLHLEYAARTLAPVALFRLLPIVHAGIGPAFTRVRIDSGLDTPTTSRQTRIGVVALIDLETPTFAHMSAVLHADYQKIGSVVAGPYDVVGIFDRRSLTFPATRLNLDHGFVGAGLAIRF